MNLNKDDVERIVRNMLKEEVSKIVEEVVKDSLTVSIEEALGSVSVTLLWDGTRFSKDTVEVNQREY
jgi:hypothetical protein